MKSFIIAAALIAVSLAGPLHEGSVSLTQDTAGNYKLLYNTEDATRHEQGFDDGRVIGSYSYRDTDGDVHTVKYIADPFSGYTAEGDLPLPVAETPEVAAVRAAHLAVVEKERSLLPKLEESEFFLPEHQFFVPQRQVLFKTDLPVFKPTFVPGELFHKEIYVDNSAEIAAVKAAHFAAHQEALARLSAEYRKVGAF